MRCCSMSFSKSTARLSSNAKTLRPLSRVSKNKIEALTAGLQKVSAQLATGRVRPIGGLELSKPAPQTGERSGSRTHIAATESDSS